MQSSFASGAKKVFFVLIGILSAATSFLFFVNAFSFGSGFMGMQAGALPIVILSGFVGVLLTDGAALAWLLTYLKASDNNQVRTIAMTGSIVGFLASALCSFAYLTLVAGNADSGLPGNIDTVVMWALSLITVVHFGLVYLTQYRSTQSQIDERMSAMTAAGTEEMLRLMEADFLKQIPHLAKANADQLVRRLAGDFSSLTQADAATAASVTHDTPPALSRGDDGHVNIAPPSPIMQDGGAMPPTFRIHNSTRIDDDGGTQ